MKPRCEAFSKRHNHDNRGIVLYCALYTDPEKNAGTHNVVQYLNSCPVCYFSRKLPGHVSSICQESESMVFIQCMEVTN